jgi:hypothetical protein
MVFNRCCGFYLVDGILFLFNFSFCVCGVTPQRVIVFFHIASVDENHCNKLLSCCIIDDTLTVMSAENICPSVLSY